MKSRFRILILGCVFAAMVAGLAEACPTCKQGIDEHGGNLVRGYFWSIMFMMSMPFLILGGLSSMFYLDVRRARQMQSKAETSAATMS